jgi:hypothetical protein
VLVTVVNNDRALPVSVGMTAPTGRILTISLDDFDDYAYKRTKVRTCSKRHVLLPKKHWRSLAYAAIQFLLSLPG